LEFVFLFAELLAGESLHDVAQSAAASKPIDSNFRLPILSKTLYSLSAFVSTLFDQSSNLGS